MTHSPTPWKVSTTPYGYTISVASGGWIFELRDGRKTSDQISDLQFLEGQDENIAFMEKAVNSHNDLVAALRLVSAIIEDEIIVPRIYNSILTMVKKTLKLHGIS